MAHPLLDRPEVLRVLFHPRREYGLAPPPPGVHLVEVEVTPGVTVGGRLYPAGRDAPAILYYHGNGEIAADYDSIGPLFVMLGITLLVVDYGVMGEATACLQPPISLPTR
jgi:hypothetical protein